MPHTCHTIRQSAQPWHCDAAGNYSEYGNLASSTWLRGIQPVDSNGVARFTTIYPGWYGGRATHIHLEVFVNDRTVKTSQIAFPEEINSTVYASDTLAERRRFPRRGHGFDRDHQSVRGVNYYCRSATTISAGEGLAKECRCRPQRNSVMVVGRSQAVSVARARRRAHEVKSCVAVMIAPRAAVPVFAVSSSPLAQLPRSIGLS